MKIQIPYLANMAIVQNAARGEKKMMEPLANNNGALHGMFAYGHSSNNHARNKIYYEL